MIAEVTAGCSRTQLSAMWVSDTPASSASSCNASTAVNLASLLAMCSACVAPREPAGGGASRRYLPVSQPPFNGDQTITPIPWRWHAGSTEDSMARVKIEYGGCSHTNLGAARRDADHCASTIRSAGQVDVPR